MTLRSLEHINNISEEPSLSVYKTVDDGSWILKNVCTHLKSARRHNPEVRNIKLGRQEHYKKYVFRARFCEFYS
jgi:hypothetical protein